MEEDIGRLEAKSKELNKDKEHLRKKLDHSRQELDQTRERLVNSQEEYTAMEKQLKQRQRDLLATQAQLDERSMPGASQEQEKLIEEERTQRFKLLDELQAVNKKNASLRKQQANSGVASMANVTNMASDPVVNYRPRGIGPKKQLTETNPSAFAP